MEYTQLRSQLPPALAPQAEDLWQRFARETQAPADAYQSHFENFLVWLRDQGHLSEQEFQQTLLQQEIEVTAFEDTQTFLATMGLKVSSEDQADQPRSAGTGPLRQHYDLIGMLGKGAMGLVHLAKDRDLQRKVAYKQLLTNENRSALGRFLREAQITAQLDHPHIVPIYGMEVQDDGSLAYSMKLVQGKTFKELISETRKFYDQHQTPDNEHSLPRLLEDFLKACDAVAYAHSKGVIHRDLKPANIMIGRYKEVYVMDWGIARVMHSAEPPEGWVELESPEAAGQEVFDDRTRAGQILGTPRYMSPQQAAGKNDQLDGRSDLFALGLILYELLTLKPAFQASGAIELLKKVLKAEKEPWVSYHPSRKIPLELQAIVEKATGRKVEERYASVSELAEDLRRYLRGEAPLARPDNSWRKLARWVGAHREISLLVLFGILICSSAAVIWSLVQQQQAMVQSRLRETRLMDFYTRVSQQGQHLDGYFQKMESMIQGLANATTQALNHPPSAAELSREPLHINNPFAKAPHKLFEAPDLIRSPYYTGEISPNWPIYVISPGVDQQWLEPKLRQLAPLRHALRQTLMDSHTDGKYIVPEAEWNKLLANQGVPILWSYVCLKEGVLYFYPGHDEPTTDYDVRIRPYFLQSKDKYAKVWGLPYDDPVGGMLIACTQGIFGLNHEFLGTVGIDIRLNYLRDHFMKIDKLPALRNSLLLNAKGEILLQIRSGSQPQHRLHLDETAKTPPYPIKAVLEAIQRQEAGGTFNEGSKGKLVGYTRLNTLGWYYVVEAGSEEVLEQP